MDVIELICSSCGQAKDNVAAISDKDAVFAVICRECLVEAINIIDQEAKLTRMKGKYDVN